MDKNLKNRSGICCLLIFLLSIQACKPAKEIESISSSPKSQIEMSKMEKRPDAKTAEGRSIISVPIVEKAFITKKGIRTDKKEFYVQRSIQDYFIKFCESEVSPEELKSAWAKEEGFIKTLRLEVEFKKGEWDRCGEEEVASRVGEYVVVYKVF